MVRNPVQDIAGEAPDEQGPGEQGGARVAQILPFFPPAAQDRRLRQAGPAARPEQQPASRSPEDGDDDPGPFAA